MEDSWRFGEDEIGRLKASINNKERTIEKQENKIHMLQEALVKDQQTIRKLESLVADQNMKTAALVHKQSILRTNCDHLEQQFTEKNRELGLDNARLAQDLKNLGEMQQRHTELISRAQVARDHLDKSVAKQSEMMQKITQLQSQKLALEQSNAEMLSYKDKAEALEEQLALVRSQVQQLELLYAKTRETIAQKDAQISQLKRENSELNDHLKKKKASNKKLSKEVAQLKETLQQYSGVESELALLKFQIARKDRDIDKYRAKAKSLHSKANKQRDETKNKYTDTIKHLKDQLTAAQEEVRVGREQIALQTIQKDQESMQNDHLLIAETEQLKRDLANVKEKYANLKQANASGVEELYQVKIAAARMEESLESAEMRIARLTSERDELRAKLISSESYIEHICERMKQAERETQIMRNHMTVVHANQREMAAVQMENYRLTKRMDTMEKDLEDYTERQRNTAVKKKKQRINKRL